MSVSKLSNHKKPSFNIKKVIFLLFSSHEHLVWDDFHITLHFFRKNTNLFAKCSIINYYYYTEVWFHIPVIDLKSHSIACTVYSNLLFNTSLKIPQITLYKVDRLVPKTLCRIYQFIQSQHHFFKLQTLVNNLGLQDN